MIKISKTLQQILISMASINPTQMTSFSILSDSRFWWCPLKTLILLVKIQTTSFCKDLSMQPQRSMLMLFINTKRVFKLRTIICSVGLIWESFYSDWVYLRRLICNTRNFSVKDIITNQLLFLTRFCVLFKPGDTKKLVMRERGVLKLSRLKILIPRQRGKCLETFIRLLGFAIWGRIT